MAAAVPGSSAICRATSATCSALFDVAREEDDAAKRKLLRQRAQLDRQLGPGKAGHQQLSDLVTKGTR